jgi:hypothetical protein
MGTTTFDKVEDLHADQIWMVCENCNCIQLGRLVPLDILYKYNHSLEVVGGTWLEHHLSFKDFILTKKFENFCEIGGSHGFLASSILDDCPIVNYVLVEPSSTCDDKRIKIVSEFIENSLENVDNCDAIIHSHVLEHVYKPRDFLKALALRMDNGSAMFMSFPNIAALIEKNGSNGLNFEHSYFLTLDNLKYLCSLVDLEIMRVERFYDHSYFVEAVKREFVPQSPLPKNEELINTKFKDLWENLEKFVEKTNNDINLEKRPVYLFGAHIFSQTLIVLGLNVKKVEGVLDNAQGKQNLRLYGTELITKSPDVLSKEASVIILKAAQYQDEIKSQILQINPQSVVLE